jgi:hypothetical protein
MTLLPTELRRKLEASVIAAQNAAEAGARAAVARFGVESGEKPRALSGRDQPLRLDLRAKAKQLGKAKQTGVGEDWEHGCKLLIEEIAYSQWHRMLFARFLAENDLLMHPSGLPVSLEECAELAADEHGTDAWQLAARYASTALPGLFPVENPCADIELPPERRLELERILADLPSQLFRADDALGWVYQFWQTKRKNEVNRSGRKIADGDIPPVTQLFTEHYMVRFLLENTLGAWWAARHPDSPLLREWEYLRFRDDGTPAVGSFPGWPDQAKKVTVMDPCCGSGHFLVAAFELLRKMRMEEEGLSASEAGDAVLRANLFGLELDGRCVQIATLALTMAAWRAGGYRMLPMPQIACSGIPVGGPVEDWTRLARGDEFMSDRLARLHGMFAVASDVGSLIDPASEPLQRRLFTAEYGRIAHLLAEALRKERGAQDPAGAVFGEAMHGVARAAEMLARQNYTLVATNVPYLQRGKQGGALPAYCEEHYKDAKADLATAHVERCRRFVAEGGTYGVVTPQNWLSLGSYKEMRKRLLREQTWNHISWLGTGAFETVGGEVVNVVLFIGTNSDPCEDNVTSMISSSSGENAIEKAALQRVMPIQDVQQVMQFRNPDARVSLHSPRNAILLTEYAGGYAGIQSGDYPRFGRYFWELPLPADGWEFQQSTVKATINWGGREHVLFWENGRGDFYQFVCERLGQAGAKAWIRGTGFAGRMGVAVSSMGQLPVTLYTGELFDNNMAVIMPRDRAHLPAIWAFCQSPEYREAVRRIDQKMNVTNATLVKVPFDLERWQRVADEMYPNGLPEPYSKDPTQWLFEGDPADSTNPLQVAVARLVGYRWPEQGQVTDKLDRLADRDGIICLSPVAGEQPAHERLRALLATAYGAEWSTHVQDSLLASVGYEGKSLEVWLRDGFFAQHCKLFHNRPFIWHIWDGRKDGFAALVNYHKLDRARLDKLIYTYLGSYIQTQRTQRDANIAGAEDKLVRALQLKAKLEAIRDGEAPYDIYVRWKPLERQPIGWEPDLNDGVRLNIRPFVAAAVLRNRFTINWNKDRGLDPGGRERLNDLHLTLARKRAARDAARPPIELLQPDLDYTSLQ